MERLALIEVFDAEGRHVHAVPVMQWPVTVGRALHCDIVINDPHVAAHHATLARATTDAGTPGPLRVVVGETRNGLRLAGPGVDEQLAAGAAAAVAPGSVCHLGRSSLRIRLADEPLAAETRLAAPGGRGHALLLAGAAAALFAWLAGEQWLQNEPGAGWDKYLPPLLAAGVGMALWSALWGLGSKIFQHHFRLLPHLRVLLVLLLAAKAVDLGLMLGGYAFSLPLLSHVRGWVEIAVFGALLATHITLLLPEREAAIRRSFALLCIAVLAVDGALSWRHHQRLFDEAFATTLAPPALRLAGARPIGALMAALKPLQEPLERRAKEDEDSDTTAPED